MGKPSICRVDEQGRECKKCGEYKAWEDFRKLKHGVNGRSPRCKDCMGSGKPVVYKHNTVNPLVANTDLSWDGEMAQAFILGKKLC